MKQELSLAYSPCPNDTFLFYHLVHEDLSKRIRVKEELHDVEMLNELAARQAFSVTKLSFFAYFFVAKYYKILNTGSALGRGCGPILIKKKGKNTTSPKNSKILIPGLKTTANLLLNIYLKKQFEPVPLRYDKVIPALLNGEYDYGVIIHEERFTYEKRGLEKVVDLGEFWEADTGKPIPLGAISIHRNIELSIQKEFDSALHKSLELAYQYPKKAKQYIQENSQDKEEEVINSHISLYVNEFTKDLGSEGKEAIISLYEKALGLGLLPETVNIQDLFL